VEGLDFTDAGGGTCTVGTHYDAGISCTVKVSFKPRLARLRSGAVFAFDNQGAPLGWTFIQGSGTGPQASFLPAAQTMVLTGLKHPGSIAVDGAGNLYFGDISDNVIYRETLNADGSYTQSTIASKSNRARTIAVDGAGNVYAALDGYGAFFFENPFGNGPYSGQYYEKTFDLGGGASVSAIAVDAAGTIYVGDRSEPDFMLMGTVKPDMSYSISNFLIGAYHDWGKDTSIAVDGDGDVFAMFDTGHIVRMARDSNWSATEVTGSFTSPISMAVDMAGDVFVGDGVTNRIYREGVGGETLMADFGLLTPEGLAVDGMGSLYVATYSAGAGGAVYKLNFLAPPSLRFASTAQGATSTDSPQVVFVENIGNLNLALSSVSFPTDFPQGKTAAGNCAVSAPLVPTVRCSLPIAFKPVSGSSTSTTQALYENVALVSNTLNVAGTTQNVKVSGTETGILKSAAMPTFTPPAGAYSQALSVTLSSATAGAPIYYTTDGKTTPTTASTKYTGAIPVASNLTIKAVAVATGMPNSPVATAAYTFTPYVARPTFTPAAGAYVSEQWVAITSTPAGATFYYTTDGKTAPTTASAKYAGPIKAAANLTIQAIGVLTGAANSVAGSAVYSISGSPTALAAGASGVVTPKATLNGVVNTNGLAGSYVFQYGISASALTMSTPKTALNASTAAVQVSAPLTTLSGKTRYYYQVAVTTAGGTATGAVMTFTTN